MSWRSRNTCRRTLLRLRPRTVSSRARLRSRIASSSTAGTSDAEGVTGEPMVRRSVLRRVHSYYVNWLFGSGGFGYSRDWIQHSPRLLFWYAIAGVPRGGEDLAGRWLALVDRGQHSRLPAP